MREYEKRRFRSSDGEHECFCIIMRPDGEPKGIVQISHGMCEYIERYADFMSYLADLGYVVCGNDHLGHGRTARTPDELGYFGSGNEGWKRALSDLHRMTTLIKAEYPGLPLILFGHSMGSFFARAYAVKYGYECAGFIFMGTADAFEADVRAIVKKAVNRMDRLNGYAGMVSGHLQDLGNKVSCTIDGKLDGKEKYIGRAAIALMMRQGEAIQRVKGEKHRSKTLTKLGFGKYNDRIKDPKTNYDWVSRDEAIVKKYAADPFCNYMFTVNGWLNLAGVMWFVSDERWYESFPKDKPTLFMSGLEDPVGSYGKGVRTVFTRLLNKRCNVKLELYEGARHELINELNRAKVYKDAAEFIGETLGK